MDGGRLSGLAPIGKIGRYDVLGRLASGGMAEVFVARASGPREVARLLVLKRLLPHVASDARKVDAFVQEARLTSRLAHPNLCAVHDFGDEGGAFHLALEWVRGPSLRRVMERARVSGGAPVPIVARIVASLASALHHAHVAVDDAGAPLGIVHRDVTPENVIVGWNGVAKLIDFGIAKSVVDPRKTEAGVLKGKLAYISPEQYGGKALDGRSDVFALSVCAFEALTGESLYERESEFETVAAIVVDERVPSVRERRPEVPEALDAIVRRGLAKDRDQRFASADELARALEGWLATRGEAVGEREVAAWLATLFPAESSRDPELDRSPLGSKEAGPRRRTRSEEMHALHLAAEVDADAERLERAQRARKRMLVLAMLLAAIAAIAVIAWAITRPRESGGPQSSDRPPETANVS